MTQRRVHRAPIERDRGICQPVAHPLQGVHIFRVVVRRTEPTVVPIEQPLGDQCLIVERLQQCPTGVALGHQLPVSPRTATVLGRTVAIAVGADGIFLVRVEGDGCPLGSMFETDVMLPIVAHVVFVDEPLRFAQFEIGEDDLVRIIGEGDPADAVDAIRLAMNAELMQMQVLPAHRDLQHVVQLGDRRVAGHAQTPPDHRGDGAQRDLELMAQSQRRCHQGQSVAAQKHSDKAKTRRRNCRLLG